LTGLETKTVSWVSLPAERALSQQFYWKNEILLIVLRHLKQENPIINDFGGAIVGKEKF